MLFFTGGYVLIDVELGVQSDFRFTTIFNAPTLLSWMYATLYMHCTIYDIDIRFSPF